LVTCGEKKRTIYPLSNNVKKVFNNISRVISFDDKNTYDKLASIRDPWDKLTLNIYRIYSFHEELTVDEQLIAFRRTWNTIGKW